MQFPGNKTKTLQNNVQFLQCLVSSFFISVLIASPACTYAQTDEIETEDAHTKDLIEHVMEQRDGTEFNYDTYLETLRHHKKKPINLNRASYDKLSDLRVLTDMQIIALQEYIDKNGKLVSIYELQAVPHMDQETIKMMQPYVKVTTGDIGDYFIPFKELISQGDYQLFTRYSQFLEQKRGYKKREPGSNASHYLGSPYDLYMRFKYNYGTRLYYGVTAEKDAGEEFFRGTQKQGFDYYSAHFYMSDYGPLNALALGDYEVKMGQGLIMWSGFGFGKSPQVIKTKKEGRTIKPYSSVNENLFLRGAATSFDIKGLTLTAFGSRKQIDGNIDQPDTVFNDNPVTTVTSFRESGYHRTTNEIADKNAVTQNIAGGAISYRKNKLRAGLNAVHYRFDKTLQQSERLYNRFSFNGDKLTNISADYSYLWRNIHVFGETAWSDNGAIATLNGFMAAFGDKANLSVVQRYYPKDFQTIYSNAFGETSNTRNETGLYMGVKAEPAKKWTVKGYFDMFKFPWLRFRTDAPSRGYDIFGQVTYEHSDQVEMDARLETEVKERNIDDQNSKIDYPGKTRKSSARYDLSYDVGNGFSMGNRIQLSRFDEENQDTEYGYMLYQDIRYKTLQFPLSLSARFAIFDTDSWDTRIYAYEHDVLYAFSIPAYFDQGTRYYLTAQYSVFSNLDVWFRIGQTFFANKETIGSGLEEIDGNTKTELKAQLRFKF